MPLIISFVKTRYHVRYIYRDHYDLMTSQGLHNLSQFLKINRYRRNNNCG